ncbi:uncharacterized protein J3D65DRAFT_667644 [Phyllosticta citribraziliensis]|uniref:BTB domain-containing protein n=1 Tax=Phyllosticta citribraziliensis TaxID=989973 RepID=A0ABR1LP18_9PEZI
MACQLHFEDLYWSGDFTDIEICFKKDCFKGHKAILCERSRVFRDILLENKALTKIELDNSPKSSVFDNCLSTFRGLVYAIYAGEIEENSECSTSEDLVSAVESHDLGIKTGTPILQEAAVVRFRGSFVAWFTEWSQYEERTNHKENARDILDILNNAIPVIFNRERVNKFPLNDTNLRKMLIDDYFPLISHYVNHDELKEALQETPDFAVEYALYLEKRYESDSSSVTSSPPSSPTPSLTASPTSSPTSSPNSSPTSSTSHHKLSVQPPELCGAERKLIAGPSLRLRHTLSSTDRRSLDLNFTTASKISHYHLVIRLDTGSFHQIHHDFASIIRLTLEAVTCVTMAEELDTACLWSRDAFTDLEIRLSDSPRTKPLKAHKAILYSRSSKFREILEKNKTATEVSIGIQDLNDNVWYHQVTKMDVTELLEAVYTGTFAAEERDGFPLAYEILRAYGFGHVTGTPLLQEAAARRFKNAISTFEECYRSRQIPDNFTFLLHAAQLLYIEPGKGHCRLDKEVDKHDIRNYFTNHGFPLIARYMSQDWLKRLLEKHPGFAVDYALFLQQKFLESQPKPEQEVGTQTGGQAQP